MASHDRFKLELIAAGKLEGLGEEGDASKGFRMKEPPYDPESNPTGVEMWKDFAIYRGDTQHRSSAVTHHRFGVAHTPTLTWKLWSSRPSERWIKQQKENKFDFPDGFYRRGGLSVGNHFQGSPVLVDGKIAFRVEHIKSKRSKIIPLDEIGKQGPCTYHFPKGFDRPGEETEDIWTQARWNAGQYPEGEELADVLGEFMYEYEEMPVIQGP
jgi:hypothetical protein